VLKPSLVACAAAAALAVPSVAAAQVSGRVVDSFNQPLSGVEVVAWGTGEVLGRVVSDSVGEFSFDVSAFEVRRISALHQGAPSTFVHEIQPPLLVTVATAPVELAGIDVTVEPVQCSAVDDPAARASLVAAAGEFSPQTGFRGLGWSHHERSSTSPAIMLPADEAWRFQGVHAQVGSTKQRTPGRSLLFESRVDSIGYAPYRQLEGLSSGWPFPALHGSDAYHFATPTFTARHKFWLESTEGSRDTIAFCPVRGGDAIRGRLYLVDGEFESAEWTFISEEGSELGGGGSVRFASVRDQWGALHLLAESGTRWRTAPNRPGYFVVIATQYDDWQISESDERPAFARIGRN